MSGNKPVQKLINAAIGTGIGKNMPVKFGYMITVQIVTTGSPTGLVVDLEGSIDGENYVQIATHNAITLGNMFHVADKGVTYVRPNVTTLSGGTSPTVTVYVDTEE